MQYPSLYDYIKRYISISVEEYSQLEKAVVLKKLKRKDYVLREGNICRSRYFVLKGCFREYYQDDSGRDRNIQFYIENWWFSNYDSLTGRKASETFLQAIEEAQVLELTNSAFDTITTEIPVLHSLFRQIMERTYVAQQKRLQFMFDLSGEEMYHMFMNYNTAFAQRIPQYMLASYLGMTPEFLSKVRAKKES